MVRSPRSDSLEVEQLLGRCTTVGGMHGGAIPSLPPLQPPMTRIRAVLKPCTLGEPLFIFLSLVLEEWFKHFTWL